MELPEKNTYVNGQTIFEFKDHKLTYFFKNGNLKAHGSFINNLMEREWKFYRESGQFWVIGNFKNGQKNGSWIRYDKKNILEYAEFFEDGKQMKK
ncbi:MAG: toxin-antitoxin system YwqK family antitoxin [Paludibacteraceae bacterium]